jgi:cytoplasmic iron level regulating protein YaaA (DUF328/UPF0246 family)
MLALISPAKKLDFETETTLSNHTQPVFLSETEKLVGKAKKLSRSKLAQTMKLSDKLAELNYQRYQDFATPFTLANAKQAALVFNGDTYVGLQASSLDEDDLLFAQDHLRILSGLYGLLRPLDLIQPYRLEMGTRFSPPKGGDLYGFWDGQLSQAINEIIEPQADRSVINLASNEYFKAVKEKSLAGPVITPVFREIKDGQARTIGMFAKQARGAMARYIITDRVESPHQLKAFKGRGYTYQADQSDETRWIFTRPQP